MPEPIKFEFGHRLLQIRLSTKDGLGKSMTQEEAARAVGVCISAWRKWEKGLQLPDNRSRRSLEAIWPQVFGKSP